MAFKLITENRLTSTTISAIEGTTVSSLPLTNLTNLQRGKVARIMKDGGTDRAKIKFLFPATTGLSGFVIGNNNFTTSTQLQLTFYSDTAAAVPVYTSATISGAPVLPFGELIWGVDPLGAPVSKFSIRSFWMPSVVGAMAAILTIEDEDLSYFNMSWCYSGICLEPNRIYSKDWNMEQQFTGESYRTQDGSLRTKDGIKYRRFDLDIKYLAISDRSLYLRKLNEQQDPFIISLMQKDDVYSSGQEIDNTALVKRLSPLSFSSPALQFFNTKFELEEI